MHARRSWVRGRLSALGRGAVAALLLVAGTPQAPAATLLTWDITGSSGSTSGSAASALVVGVSGSIMSSGTGTTTGNTTSPSNTWNRTYTGILATATDSLANGAYVEWTTTASPGYIVSFNGMTGMNLSRTSTGPTNAALFYSTDGGLNFVQTGSAVTVTSTLTSAAPAFGSMMASTPIVLDGGAGGASILWRLVGFGTGSGRMGIGKAATDDFSLLGSISGGNAQNLIWVGTAGNGIWDTDPANTAWTTGSNAAAFATNDNAAFTTSGTVTVAAGVTAGAVTVSHAAGSLRLEGNGFAGTTLTKSGGGTLILAAANTLSGGVAVTGGVLVPGATGAFGTQPLLLNGGVLSFADPASLTLTNPYATGTAGAMIHVPDAATISGVGTALGTQAGAGIARGDSRTFNTLEKTGTGTLSLTGNLGAQMSYDQASGNVTTAGGINLQIREGAVEISGNRTWNLATGTAVTTGSTTFNGMQWDGNVHMRGGTIQINGGNVQGSGTIQVGLAGDAVTANTLQGRLYFAAPSIANTVAIADGFTLTLTSNVSSSIRLTGQILGGPTATITNAGNGTATITGTVPSSFAGTFVVTGSQGGMSLTPQAMASATKVTNNNSLTIANSVASATTSTLIEGTGSVTINGAEKVTVSGSNTYAGGTRLLSDVGMTKLWDGIDGSLGPGLIWSGNADGRVFWDGPDTAITFTQAVATGSAATDRLAFAGTGKTFVPTGGVSGTGVLRASAGVVLDLTQQSASTNTNLGGVEIGNATVRAGSDENLGGGGLLFSGTSSVFVATSATTSLARPITIGAAGGSGIAARFDTNGTSVSLSGTIADAAGTTGGGLVKIGAGRLALSASNAYTGPTLVSEGTLALEAVGAIATSSTISIDAGTVLDVSAMAGGLTVGGVQTLAGSGTVAGSASIGGGGTLSPGASPGTLSLTDGLTWSTGGNYNWQMLSGTGTAGTSSTWDLVSVSGTLAIAATNADPFKVNLWTLAGIGPDVSGTATGFDPSASSSWRIATAAGGISGFAADKFVVSTSATNGTGGFANSFGGGTFSIAQSGNDLNLVFTAGSPAVITIAVPSGTQTQTQAGYPLLSGSTPVVKTGAGTLVVDQANTLTGSTTVEQGRLQFGSSGSLGASRIVPLAGASLALAPAQMTTVGGLAANAGGLTDVGNGSMTVSAGLSTAEMLVALAAGRGDGTWTGTSGITSSQAEADLVASIPRIVGWLDNGDGSVTFAYAAPGDTNLDWNVDILDAANFLAGGKFDSGTPGSWNEGDFGYDGVVDILDAADFLSTGLFDAGPYNTPPGEAGSIAAVPEPSSWGGVAVAVAVAAFARRRLRPTGSGTCGAFLAILVAFASGGARADTLVQFLINTATTGAITMPGSVTTVTGLSSTLMTGSGGTTTTGNTSSPAGTWNRTYPSTQATGTGSLAAGNWITWTTTAATGYEYSFNGLTGLNISRNSTGPTTAGLFYSTDGGVSFAQTGGNFVTSSTLTPAASTFSTTMSSTPIKLLSGTTGIIWRLVGFGSGISRMGIGTADAVDFTMLGTVDVTPALNLTWAAAGGTGTWDTSAGNLSWTNNSGGAAAPFTNGDNVTFGGTGGVVTVSDTVSPGTVAVTNASGTYQMTGGAIRATGAATKTGAGTLVLASSGSYALGWQVSGGTLVPDAADALGSASIAINGATLAVTNPAVSSLSNTVAVGSAGATLSSAADVTLSGAVTGATGYRVVKTGTGNLTLSGQFGVQSSSPMELDLAEGTTTLSGGQKNVTGTSNWDAPVTLAGAIVHLHGSTITGSGTIATSGTASKFISRFNAGAATIGNAIVVSDTLTIESPNGTNRLTIAGPISGSGGLSLIGNGAKSLDGANTYTGPTSITAGSVRVNGSITNESTVTVASGAQLGGNGTVDSTATLQANSTLSLVDGVGASALSFGKGLAVDAASTTQWYLLSNTDAAGAAGSTLGYSQTRVTGGNLTLADGAAVSLNFQYLVGGTQVSTVAWTDPFWTANRSWKIADYSGSGTATVANYTISGTTFTDSTGAVLDLATQGSFSVTNDGQDAYLLFTAVPEPTTSVAALSTAVLVAVMLRRRG